MCLADLTSSNAGVADTLDIRGAPKRVLHVPRYEKTVRLEDIFHKYWEDLCYLSKEFTLLKERLEPNVSPKEKDVQSILSHLALFLEHLNGTILRMCDARRGINRYSLTELNELESHIRLEIIPVKQRLMSGLYNGPLTSFIDSGKKEFHKDFAKKNGKSKDQKHSRKEGRVTAISKYRLSQEGWMGDLNYLGVTPLTINETNVDIDSPRTDIENASSPDVSMHRKKPCSSFRIEMLLSTKNSSANSDFQETNYSDECFSTQKSQVQTMLRDIELDAKDAALTLTSLTRAKYSPVNVLIDLSETDTSPAVSKESVSVSKKGKSMADIKSSEPENATSVPCAYRPVVYICEHCKMQYTRSSSGNPWWEIMKHECPTCKVVQVPRVDILHPTNNIDSHTGQLSCAYTSDSGSVNDSSDEGSDIDDSEVNEEVVKSMHHSAGLLALTAIGKNDPESGAISFQQGSKLLVLMEHARFCKSSHSNPSIAQVCMSTKFLMLHLRDCSGQNSNGRACPHSWCKPVKDLLLHLLHCPNPKICQVCSPKDLSHNLAKLQILNKKRLHSEMH